jgi:hypothetical protein
MTPENLGPCEEWAGYRDKDGYGQTAENIPGRSRRAHKAVWENAYGPVPSGLFVLHLCNNPPCYRLSHLKLGTHQENMDYIKACDRDGGGKPRTPKDIIEKIRASSGTQRAVAKTLGVSHPTVGKYRRVQQNG